MARQILLRATGAICVLLLPAGAAIAGADLVSYPDGYQESFTHFTTRNRADERKQVVKIFANDVGPGERQGRRAARQRLGDRHGGLQGRSWMPTSSRSRARTASSCRPSWRRSR